MAIRDMSASTSGQQTPAASEPKGERCERLRFGPSIVFSLVGTMSGSGRVGRVRVYDIDLASSMLRSLAYMGRSASRVVQMGRDYIVANQDGDGSFGFLGVHVSADKFQRTKLSCTVLALWMLLDTAPVTTSLVLALGQPSLPPCTRTNSIPGPVEV